MLEWFDIPVSWNIIFDMVITYPNICRILSEHNMHMLNITTCHTMKHTIIIINLREPWFWDLS